VGKRGTVGKNKLPVASVNPVMKDRDRDDDMKWRAKSALDDIKRADMHRNDPKLMEHVKALAKQEVECLKKVSK
jgi:hypothetical protein